MPEFVLPDMTCGHCVKAVTAVLQAADAAAGVQVDLAAQRVRVDSSLPAERLAAVLAEAGYPPAPASAA
jgi:copper chaperone